MPFFAVKGNKEASQKEFEELFINPSKLNKHGKNWILSKNGFIILGLDSSIKDANNGLFDTNTISFAKKILDKNQPTVILNHHPYTNFWNGTNSDDIHKYVLNNTKEVQKKLFQCPNLLLTLSGHKHIDSVSHIHGVKVIATRALIRPLDVQNFPMRYIHLHGTTINEKLIYTA